MWMAIRENGEEFIINLSEVDDISLRHTKCGGYFIEFCGSSTFRICFRDFSEAYKAYLKILNTLQHPDGTKLIDLRGFKTDSDYYE